MQTRPRRPLFSTRSEVNNANVTSAIGMEESVGHLRARRNSFFTRTVMWITGLVCTAFLLGSLAQAWSNSNLMQQVDAERQILQQQQQQHNRLVSASKYYRDPTVIENEARQQLGYIRPGEHPVVVIGSDKQGPQNSQKRSDAPAPQGFWQEWWHTFFGS